MKCKTFRIKKFNKSEQRIGLTVYPNNTDVEIDETDFPVPSFVRLSFKQMDELCKKWQHYREQTEI